MSASSNTALVGKLLEAFVKILDESTPQFVSENNTLRKLILELLLRMGPTEAVKTHAKAVYSLLLRIVVTENVFNTLLYLRQPRGLGRQRSDYLQAPQ